MFAGLHAGQIEAKISEKKPDGSVGKSVAVSKETLIGREGCDLSYPQDQLLSLRHASLRVREGKLVLRDLNSQNGSFIRQREDTELCPGDVSPNNIFLWRSSSMKLYDPPLVTSVLCGKKESWK